MKKLTALILAIVICVPFVSCTLSNQDEGEEYLLVEITQENYKDYIGFEFTENAIDAEGNPIEGSCVVVTSKVFDDGLYYLSSSKGKWDLTWNNTGVGTIGGSPYGLIIEDTTPENIKVAHIEGTYKFVKSEYVEEYIFENGIRKITMKDGRYQELSLEGVPVDYSNPY